jgi:hypothetical protein
MKTKYFKPKKRFNYLTGWPETKPKKSKPIVEEFNLSEAKRNIKL